MINKLRIQNFKSWQDTGEINLGNITGFFGANSSGKSSLLQFLLLLKQTVEDTSREKVLNLGDEKSFVRFSGFSDILNRFLKNDPLKFSIQWYPTVVLKPNNWKTMNCMFNCSIDLLQRNGVSIPVLSGFSYYLRESSILPYKNYLTINCKKSLQNKLISYSKGKDYFLSTNLFHSDIVEPLSQPLRFYGFPRELVDAGKISEEFMQMPSAVEKLMGNFHYLGPLREELHPFYKIDALNMTNVGSKGENAIPALISWRDVVYIRPTEGRNDINTAEMNVAHWLKKMGLIEEFVIKETYEKSELFTVEVRYTAESPWVNILDVGFGVSQVLPVIILCFVAPEGSTLLIEQPEIHLHPAAQYWLTDLFIEVAKERNLQIIFESHSEHILNRLQRRIAENQISNENVSIYFTSIENGASKLTPLKLDEFGNISNWPQDFFGDKIGELTAMTVAAMKRQGVD